MKKVKVEKEEKKSGNGVEYYFKFNNYPMVKFEAGSQMGKKKIKAILANIEELKKFVNGDYDEEIKSLEEGEVLKP